MTAGTQTQAWPEGVIARYLTVGGATVDITRVQSEPYESFLCGELTTRVEVTFTLCCTGERCAERNRVKRTYDADAVDGKSGDFIVEKLQEHAQQHAERCRAMSKPDGA